MRRTILTILLALSLVNLSAWAQSNKNGASPDNSIGTNKSIVSSSNSSSEVASTWFEALYDIVKREGTPPPQASRIYGITAVGLYESIVPGFPLNHSLVGQLNGLVALPAAGKSSLHWPTAANSALANTIRGLFPTLSSTSVNTINGVEKGFETHFRKSVPTAEFNRSVFRGQAVAAAILEWASHDGFSTANNCPYVPAAVPGAWQPTPPGFNPNPLQPCWGQIRTMVLTSGAECPPPGHPAFSTTPGSAFHNAALEVFNVGAGLTAEQRTIATYWADGPVATGTPPGHWIAIVSQIARNDNLSLITAAEAYARVGIAVHDAFINCWNWKYVTNLQRPVTYIRANINASFTPFIGTPGFPTYTSGHSTQSGASARVLTDMFGIKSFTDTTHTDHGLMPPQQPRTFASFEEASAEAAVSRLYGGIHYAFDNNDGLGCGECIGQAIHDRVNFR